MKITNMPNLLKIRILAFFLLITMVQSCRKDKTEPIVEPNPIDTTSIDSSLICDDFPESPQIGFYYYSTGAQYKAPSFNPNNSDEFVYLRTGVIGTELVKYSISQQSETVLTNSVSIITQPQWGEQGWIVFTVLGNTIWKIYEDGSGLEQITDFESFRPSFDKSGNNFICMGGGSDVSAGYRPIFDLTGNISDSVFMAYDQIIIGYPYVSTENFYKKGYFAFADHAYSNPIRIGICSYDGSSITELSSWLYDKQMLDVTANSTYIYISTFWKDMVKINLTNPSYEIFKTGCQTKYYNHIDMSADGTKIIAQVVLSTPTNENSAIDEQNEIWLINLITGEEEIILGEE